jgi:hypothetical protein
VNKSLKMFVIFSINEGLAKMTNSIIFGIENEFSLYDNAERIKSPHILNEIISHLEEPYFLELRKEKGYKLLHCYRFKSGGSFYIDDGGFPEVTSAPSYLFPGSITTLVNNLNINKNFIALTIEKINQLRQTNYYLKGWSTHFNFSFQLKEKTQFSKEIIPFFLMTTVNPAIYLFIQYQHSKGVMYRYRKDSRNEICGDYLATSKKMVLALSFLSLIFSTILSMADKSEKEIKHFFHYSLKDKTYQTTKSRPGYLLHLPEVLQKGRATLLSFIDPYGKEHLMTAQNYLEFLYEKIQSSAHTVLNKMEQNQLREAIFDKCSLPCDQFSFEKNYFNLQAEQTQNCEFMNPLASAFGQSIEPIVINSYIKLHPVLITWEKIIYSLHYFNTLSTISITLHNLHDFFYKLENWKSTSLFDNKIFFDFIKSYQVQ